MKTSALFKMMLVVLIACPIVLTGCGRPVRIVTADDAASSSSTTTDPSTTDSGATAAEPASTESTDSVASTEATTDTTATTAAAEPTSTDTAAAEPSTSTTEVSAARITFAPPLVRPGRVVVRTSSTTVLVRSSWVVPRPVVVAR